MTPRIPRVGWIWIVVLLVGAASGRAGQLDDLEKNATGNSAGSGGQVQNPYPGKTGSPATSVESSRDSVQGSVVGAILGALINSASSSSGHQSSWGGIFGATSERARILDNGYVGAESSVRRS